MLETRKIQVAVSGGGLAGAAIAKALYQKAHMKRMAVGLAINAQRALSKLVPDLGNMFERADAVAINSTRVMLAAGPHAGTKVIDLAEENPGKTLHRAALVRELLDPIPKDCLHAGKKLVKITNPDGIFGTVRAHVLGEKHEAVKPVAADWAGVMNMVPFPKAEANLGAETLTDNRQYGRVSDGGILIHDSVMGGKMVQCIGTSVVDSTSGTRRIPIDREYLNNAFASCIDGHVARGMIDYEYKNALTYVKERVCIAGDAAHAMTPWQGSGAATALEDAVILGALFEQIRSPDEVEQALKVYDAVRLPRSQRIAESSRQTGRILSGIASDIGLDPVKMYEALVDRWGFIYDFDLDRHVEDAIISLQDVT
ncbi:hypothetical protein DE146DRAFT_749137 [Phaeosphaeria sp. MPI-PUGE-AT-0046c]|nr:hypothetical protein DE146DRAFT_749137 [Phaeosphaeria sp. MPI-PUGE-AT-0046c]